MTETPLPLPLTARLRLFLSDREYYRRLGRIALPITLQQFISASLNMVGVLMIGQLGETSVAAVGLANQIFFLLQLVLFGVVSGCAIFTAQLWGKQDIANIRRVLGLSLMLGLAASTLFLLVAELLPEAALGVYSKDPQVVALGGEYLRLFGWSFLFTAVSFSFASVLRSIGDVNTPLVISTSALVLNALLSFGLIFGNFGLPKMGVMGAALAALTARILECSALVAVPYLRKSPAAASLRELLRIDLPFVVKVLKPVLPVALNELLWSLGITTYNVVYARISTEAIAAMNIASTIENLALTIFIGLGHACAILVGHWIGAEDEDQAHRYAARTLFLSVTGALLFAGLILAGASPVLSLYKVSPRVVEYTRKVLTILACLLWLRVSNVVLFLGILRSGGDTRFALLLDGVIIWAVGVPLAFAGAFVFHLPVYWVYLLVMSEELAKWALALWRFFSRRWIHNLASTV